MSFCQNKCQGHQNHHCVHAHNCTSHDHKNARKDCKKYKNIDIMPTAPNKSAKKLKIISQEKQQCHFNQNHGGFYRRQDCLNCKKLTDELINVKKRFQEVRKEINQLQRKNTKICDENRQLHGVIEYYRQELDRVTKCNSEDIRIQIKRHMKQNTQLVTKNKTLLHKLYQYEQLIQKLTKQNDQLFKIISGLKNEKNQLASSYNLLIQKFRRLKAEDSGKQGDITVQKKKNQQVQQKYQIIVEEIRINLQKNMKQNKKLSSQNQNLRQQLQIYKVKIVNSEKMSRMEVQSILQRQKVLKMKVQSYQKQIKDLRQQLSKLQQALKIKQEQLVFSKKVIEKQLKLIQQNKQLFNKLNQQQHKQNRRQQHNRPANNRHNHGNNPNSEPFGQHHHDHNQNQQAIIIQLKKQIKALKQKIIILQGQSKGKGGHSIQSIQQYIITIGASEAFKRIIEQKNTYIRKLIKQKEALLKKVT